MGVDLRHESDYVRRLASATYRNVARRGRAARLKTLGQWWLYLGESRLQQRWPYEIWPGIERVRASVTPRGTQASFAR